MKLSLLLTTLFFTLLAQSKSMTVITPSYPIKACEAVDEHGYLNQITDLEIIENKTELLISFNTSYYQKCKNEEPILKPISEKFFFEIWKEGINWPWTKSPFEREIYELKDSKIVQVEFTFNKVKEFKDRNKRHLEVNFYPDLWNRKGLIFEWNMTIEKIDDYKSSVKFN